MMQNDNTPGRENKPAAGNSNQPQDNIQGSNKIKDPDNWTTGDERMTAAQHSYLLTISGGEVREDLTKAEAAKMIDEYKNKAGQSSANAGGSQNAIKDPDDWTTGQEQMTDAQKSYLKTLSDEAGEAADENLTKSEASKKIEELQHKTGRGTQEDPQNA